MKKLLLILGIILVLASLFSIGQYIGDYQVLSEYGKGFIWGKILLLAAGAALIFAAWRRKRGD